MAEPKTFKEWCASLPDYLQQNAKTGCISTHGEVCFDAGYRAGYAAGLEAATDIVNKARGEGYVDLRSLASRIRALKEDSPNAT